jgi:hypothetical protein
VKAIRLAALVAAVFVAATLVSTAGAGTGVSTPTVDLSTNQAVTNYLTSLGIDPTGVVIQRGALNYAGPSCPGTGWTCTTSTKVVQVAQPGGQNQVACGAGANMIPDSYLTTTLTQAQVSKLLTSSAPVVPVSNCTAVQAGAQTNDFRCVRRDTTEPTTQNCASVQPGTGGASNRAFVLEIANQSTGPSQQATQTATIDQTATGGADNFVHVIQDIKQSTKIAADQTQQGDQSTCAHQSSDAGSEFSQVIQSLAQKEQGGAPTQNQNVLSATKTCVTPAFTSTANMFAGIQQDSTSGALESHVNQSHNLDARSASATSQTQGNPVGGIQGKVNQTSTGTAKSFGVQNEDQNLAANSPTVTQQQFGPLTCCSTQSSNPNDNVRIFQTSAQSAVSSPLLGDLSAATPNPNAYQQTDLEGNFETTGDGQITHKAQQNEGGATASCPPDGVTIGEGGATICSLSTFGVNGEFPPIDF